MIDLGTNLGSLESSSDFLGAVSVATPDSHPICTASMPLIDTRMLSSMGVPVGSRIPLTVNCRFLCSYKLTLPMP